MSSNACVCRLNTRYLTFRGNRAIVFRFEVRKCDNLVVLLFAGLVVSCFVFFTIGFLKLKIEGSTKLLKATCCYFLCIAVFILANLLLINRDLIGNELLVIGYVVSFLVMASHLTILSDE